jgi:TonB family protein
MVSSIGEISGRALALVLLLAGTAPLAGAAEAALTWEEANRRSAALIREQGPSREAAKLARQAFDLYGDRGDGYVAPNHAQLLLNAVDARLRADGATAALDELDRGTRRVETRAGAGSPLLLELWREGIRICQEQRDYDRVESYYRRSSTLAAKLWGAEDPRAVMLEVNWAEDLAQRRGASWMRRKLEAARERAVEGGSPAGLVSRIDLALAKLAIESSRVTDGIRRYEELVSRLEQAGDADQGLMLQLAYGQLEYAYERAGRQEAAASVRERRNRHAGVLDELVPIAKVVPRYPREAARARAEGWVDIRLVVAPDGSVRDATVVEASPPRLFDDAALKAVRQWKFKPKVVDGQAVEVIGLQKIEFSMGSR